LPEDFFRILSEIFLFFSMSFRRHATLLFLLALLIGATAGSVGSFLILLPYHGVGGELPPNTSVIQTSTVTAIVPITQNVTVSTTLYGSPQQNDFFDQTTGLLLQMSVNTTVIEDYNSTTSTALLVSLTEFNTLFQQNNISQADDWKIQGISSGNSCNAFNSLGIAVFSGYYTQSNISNAANPLQLFVPPPPCPYYPNPVFFVFQQDSQYAEVENSLGYQLSISGNTTLTTTQIGYEYEPVIDTFSINGYCCQQSVGRCISPCAIFTTIPFPTGTYTLVGGDAWGGLVVSHFIVISQSATATANETSTSESHTSNSG
jgi:hypothetical protein